MTEGGPIARKTTTQTDPELNELTQQSTYIEDGAAAHLSQDHRAYLLERHGTLALDPIPSADPADPYNWPSWKKNINLVLVAFHACMTTFFAAGIIPAFEDIAMDLDCSLQRASYLVSCQIAVLGWAPLFWKPISNRYGRRPVWLISTILAGVCNIGCAESHSYGAMAACRCLVAFFISPAIAIGSGVVVETFFKKDRGQKMGIWTLMVTLGPPGGPFFMGFVAYHVGYRWIYWIFAIINAVQFFGYFFFGPETRYIRQGVTHSGSAFKKEYFTFGRIDPKPLSFIEFIQPAFLARYPSILIPTISYTVVFGFASVFLTVEIPQIFIPKFGLNPQQQGLQFLGLIIGSIIGEQLGGPLSDFWINRKTKKVGGAGMRPKAEYRLWLSYLGFLLTIVGLIVFGIRTQQATPKDWNMTPIVGIALAACGNQIITTVLVTFAVDCHQEHSSSIGVFVNLVRSTWGFIVPFWSPNMITSIGMSGSGGLMAGLIFACSVVPVVLLHANGWKWRVKRGDRESAEGQRGD
ncbi:MFS general substrate transporter [Lepidopterella palustris CBS 459.81]|uniref:MFS general substrate transporter n=1 Tax=Lepidopterella palustris CBS 459.81 TaxID=1314670 RepID=A0A8E2E6U8_9PEZI|nr:MFS general substrate transporter [Lepidopterella palustris CBS 459.81]